MAAKYPLSPAMWRFVEHSRAFASDSPCLDAQRAAYARMCQAFAPPRPAGLRVLDSCLPAAPPVRVRRYRPDRPAPPGGWPALLYLHGGGWMLGGLDSHDFICADLAARLGLLVLAVDYRLAPEHPFPAALQDCLRAWQALSLGELDEALDGRRLLVAGDSAGGNLAAALCLALRDGGAPSPAAQILLYPLLSAAPSPSRIDCVDAPLLGLGDVQTCLDAYLPLAALHRQPLALPLEAADFTGLPPAFVAVAEFDPLRDDGERYGAALRAAGGEAGFYPGNGLVHGCLRGHGIDEVEALHEALRRAVQGFLAEGSGERQAGEESTAEHQPGE
ncbi:TPA: acylcarnitine hydrolase [Pseudomonas aeruginosa]|nr:acylcarnitine hydrolase [Pseudomonas aeruginosa]